MQAAVMPFVETLERRMLFTASLSAGATLSADGTLQIEGTRRDDVIFIAHGLRSPSRFLVSVNGIGTTFRAKSVTRISVIAGLGNDVVNREYPYTSRFEVRVIRPATIMGGGGNDDIDGTLGTSLIDGGDGVDYISGFSIEDTLSTLRGGAGDDHLYADLGRNIIEGGPGADKILGSDGDDLIIGGPGNDTIDGTGGSDTIIGGSGDDFLASDTGKGGIIEGGRGDDALMGNRTAIMFGNAGNDKFRAYSLRSIKDAVPGEVIVIH